jgi:hypothetical protein
MLSKLTSVFDSNFFSNMNKNKTILNGIEYLESASGNKIPMTQISSILDGLNNKTLKVDEVINMLPRQLADGTNFRQVVLDKFSNKNLVKNIGTPSNQLLSKLSSSFDANFLNSMNKNKTIFNGLEYLESASGNKIPMTQVLSVLDGLQNKTLKIEDVINTLPRQLADGTNFRQVIFDKFSPQNLVKNIPNAVPSWVKSNWFITTKHEVELDKLFGKAKKLETVKFNPKDVKVVNKTNISGREVLEIKLPTGDNMIVYKSTGKGAPGLKQAGDWQVIAGFIPKIDNPNDVMWFIKNEPSTQLTKGMNPYLTELDKFLKVNGPDKLG